MSIRKSGPKRSGVARYWKEKADELWNSFASGDWTGPRDMPHWLHHLAIDAAEVECFGCGRYFGCLQDYFDDWEKRDLFAAYDAVHGHCLNKAHIVAHADGGSNTADNLVLLCQMCHSEAPDNRDRSLMMRWLANRKQCIIDAKAAAAMATYKAEIKDGKELDHITLFAHIHDAGLKEDYESFRDSLGYRHKDTFAEMLSDVKNDVICWIRYARERLGWDV